MEAEIQWRSSLGSGAGDFGHARFGHAKLRFEIVFEMAAGLVHGLIVALQAGDHQAALESADDGGGHGDGINVRADFTRPLALLHGVANAGEPAVESAFGFAAQEKIAVVGINGGVEQRTSTGNQALAAIAEI